VQHETYLDHIARQAEALRSAAVAAGQDAEVPTCPEWNVLDLVHHQARVHAMARAALATDPNGDRPQLTPPREWDELLAWWDKQLAELLDALRTTPLDAPAWSFHPRFNTAAFWPRRQAHETAIHRLDAEHALAGSAAPTAVPTLIFDPDLASDGIDELLTVFVSGRPAKIPVDAEKRVVFHAADAGRLWVAHLRPDQPIEISPAQGAEIADDASVVGTADAVYRAVWKRPSTALISGDATLLDAFMAP
jgi:uncharacterized protein (TIGR03083 family)